MKRASCIAVLVLISLWSSPGCSTAVRYSADEIKDYPPAVREQIEDGSIATGMTFQQVRYAWGSPSEVIPLALTEDGKQREEWVYSRMMGFFKTRLYFTDGKLTEIVSTEPGITK
ncbi:MAG TPA: hypothetical protein VFG09_03305 [Thermodesulfovibrionales bacterium]|jgi:hypothetical protein|nr:hypothetical protein [Thermodesulfovibrionales bacterium]